MTEALGADVLYPLWSDEPPTQDLLAFRAVAKTTAHAIFDDQLDPVAIDLSGASPAPRQPGAVTGLEETLARTYHIDPQTFRLQVWTNLVTLVGDVEVDALLPAAVRRMAAFVRTRQED